MNTTPTVSHAFHHQVEALIYKLGVELDAVNRAQSPRSHDVALYGDERTLEERVADFERHRGATVEALTNARAALLALDRSRVEVSRTARDAEKAAQVTPTNSEMPVTDSATPNVAAVVADEGVA